MGKKMNRRFSYIIHVLIIVLFWGCKSYSKFAIDKNATIKIDTNLLGIWKISEDTDKANYLLVQSPYDVYLSAYSSDSPHYDPQYYERYDRFLLCNNSKYFITRFTAHGKNPQYQQWDAFLSKVKAEKFININYAYTPYTNGRYETERETHGYFFVRLMKVNTTYDSMAITIATDTTLRSTTSSKEVRKMIQRNLDNPAFYKDTLHCYKVSGYHLSLVESMKKAN